MDRYYPSLEERSILKYYIMQYFSYPKRSLERTYIVREAYNRLSIFSNYWTIHNVRIYFNNNSYTYFIYAPHEIPSQNSFIPQNFSNPIINSIDIESQNTTMSSIATQTSTNSSNDQISLMVQAKKIYS